MNNKTNLVQKVYREKDILKIQSKLNYMGFDKKIDAITFMNIRLIVTLFLFTTLLLVFNNGYVIAPIVTLIVYFLFNYLFIDNKIKKRVEKLDKEALHFFEILTLTLESGRNLEKALEVTCFNVESELSSEFKKTLFEMKFGKSLSESLEGMKKRIPSETVNNIILNITQTDVFGNSIIDTMNNQIEFLREKQLLETKERINKIPNKVSILSVVFVLPLILILVVAPFLISFLGLG